MHFNVLLLQKLAQPAMPNLRFACSQGIEVGAEEQSAEERWEEASLCPTGLTI